MQKTENESNLEPIYRKSSLPSIGSEAEIDQPLQVVSSWIADPLSKEQTVGLRNLNGRKDRNRTPLFNRLKLEVQVMQNQAKPMD